MKNINKKGKWRRFNTSPYSWIDSCKVVFNNLTGPRKKPSHLQWIAQDEVWNDTLDENISCLFLGDFLSIQNFHIEFDEDLYALAAESDFIVVNLEGNLTENKQWSLFHQHNALDKFLLITRLKPAEKIIVSLANNHAADYDVAGLYHCKSILEQYGFTVIGLKDSPAIELADDVWLHAASLWSNQPTSEITAFYDIKPVPNAFNILYPHWGYELELNPRKEQINEAQNLITQWDMIIGHHAHVPQAIVKYVHEEKNKLVAYSLGDFACQFNRKHYRHGSIVRVQLAKEAKGQIVIQRVQWSFVFNELKNNIVSIGLKKTCPFFDDIPS